jgi:hypothetical protein
MAIYTCSLRQEADGGVKMAFYDDQLLGKQEPLKAKWWNPIDTAPEGKAHREA